MTTLVEIPLPVDDLRYIIKMLRRDLHRAIKERDQSDFVPQPGKRDAKIYKIDRLAALLSLLDEYV